MTANEVVALLAYMSAAWPNVEITEDTARLWSKHLDRLNGEDALAAADTLIRSSDFFPSVAQLLQVAKPHTADRVRREQAADYERKALAAGPVIGDVDKLRRVIRQTLTVQAGHQHLHGKHGPCPVPDCPSTTKPAEIEVF